MSSPLVSVCLPNLNTRPYLQERVDTILGQTYANWEMVISDNFSTDGSWEFFEELARQDPRVLIAQAPRQGLYANWNNCIRRAQGKYIYIATSDDTMALDCLEKLVAALEEHEDCDLAHCPLVFIDPAGDRVSYPKWPDCTVFAHGIRHLTGEYHVRRAPYDGLLHLSGKIVYLSITELLIRRSLFTKIGEFESRWGSVGDINWDMKAGLVANTVHVPDTWASFRRHPAQATASVQFASEEHARKVEEMAADAWSKCEPYLSPEVAAGLRDYWLDWSREMRTYYARLSQRSAISKRLFQVSQFFQGGKAASAEVGYRLAGKPKWCDRAPGEIRAWLESVGLGPVVVPV